MDKREHVRKLPPLASSEDLSEDLLDSPDADLKNKCLEGIEEVSSTPVKLPRQQTICLAMPNTPRIDISRASSSSHHDDSSPERDLFVGELFGEEGFITIYRFTINRFSGKQQTVNIIDPMLII